MNDNQNESYLEHSHSFDNEELSQIVNDALEHHGVPDQEWGRRNGPPYPLNREGKKRLAQQRKKKKIQDRIKKEEERRQKKDAKLAKTKAKYAKTPKSLYKHRDLYTYKEIAEILEGFEWGNRIKEYSQKDLDNAKKTFESIAKTAGSLVSFANSAIEGYNMVAGVSQSFGWDNNLKTITYKKPNTKEDKPGDKDGKK